MENSKKILAIDIGTTSAAIIYLKETEGEKVEILDKKLLLFPFPEADNYITGSQSFQTNASVRRNYRLTRRLRKQRKKNRKNLLSFLNQEFNWVKENKNLDVNKLKLEGQQRKLSTEELCAVISNFGKYRGFDFFIDEEEKSTYKQEANVVKNWCEATGKTVTSYLYEHGIPFHKSTINTVDNKEEKKNPPPIHENLHREELKRIINKQKEFYPQLTDDKIKQLFAIIYYKKEMRSQKHLLSNCELEKGKKVVNVSNPYFELFRIWQDINHIKISGKDFDSVLLNKEEAFRVYQALISCKTEIKANKLLKIIGRGKEINFEVIKGAPVTTAIKEILPNLTWDQFYNVWHKIYSHKKPSLVEKSLKKYFEELNKDKSESDKINLSKEEIESLSSIPVKRTKYCKYSEKALKKLLPYMNYEKNSYNLHDAKKLIYGEQIEEKQNEVKKYLLENVPNNCYRNPVVEKGYNQIVSPINEMIEKYGKPDSVRVELVRELTLPKKRREKITKKNRERENSRNGIKNLLSHLHIKHTSNNIRRVELWFEQGGKINKDFSEINLAIDVYTGKPISLSQALNQSVTNIEHTLCKSRFFDDSSKYTTLAFEDFNKNVKGNKTAFEVAQEIFTPEERKKFYERLDVIYKDNKQKRKTFKYGYDNFPDSIPANQATLTSYIGRLVVSELKEVFDNVQTSSGGVTAFIRNQTGVDARFKEFIQNEHPEMFEDKPAVRKGQNIILKSEGGKKGKRADNRHHMLDALIIAITKTSYIQTVANLNKYYMDNKNKDPKLLQNQTKKILDDLAYRFGSLEAFSDFAMDVVKSSIVKMKRPKHVAFTKNGVSGLRGSLHAEQPIAQTELVPVFIIKGKDNKTVLNPLITSESVHNKNLKELISNYANINEAFEQNKYLKKLIEIKVKIDLSDKVVVNNNAFNSDNNHHVEIYKVDKDKYTTNVIPLNKYLKSPKPEQEPLMVLHKRDYVCFGLTSEEIDEYILTQQWDKLSSHLYYMAKSDSFAGKVYFQKHYLSSNAIPHLSGSFNSLVKKFGEDKIIKMRVLNNGSLVRYQKVNSKIEALS
jgi:CRISPR-associated endonuclease Csn1